jgi:hypothetical protein
MTLPALALSPRQREHYNQIRKARHKNLLFPPALTGPVKGAVEQLSVDDPFLEQPDQHCAYSHCGSPSAQDAQWHVIGASVEVLAK